MSSDLRHIEAAVTRAAGFVQATWQQAAMGTQTLPGMKTPRVNLQLRQLYANSIVTNKQLSGGGSVAQTVTAIKKIAEQLEKGCGPFDMKPMLLAGPKARVGKNGRYNIIPFRHGTSDQGGVNTNFKPMPQDIYKAARQLKAGKRLMGTEAAYGPGKNPTSGYQHKNGRYEGMVKVEKPYAQATQSKYLTFRVVSDKSDPGSWIHPGYQPHNIAAAVSRFCQGPIEDMVRQAATQDLVDAVTTMKVQVP